MLGQTILVRDWGHTSIQVVLNVATRWSSVGVDYTGKRLGPYLNAIDPYHAFTRQQPILGGYQFRQVCIV